MKMGPISREPGLFTLIRQRKGWRLKEPVLWGVPLAMVMVARLLRRMACETGRISARGKRKTQDWARTAFLAPSPLEKNSHRSTARQRVRAGSLPPRNHAADAACASFIWFASSASWPATWVSAWT